MSYTVEVLNETDGPGQYNTTTSNDKTLIKDMGACASGCMPIGYSQI